LQFLQKLVQNGPDVWPGAKSYIRPDGCIFDIANCMDRSAIQLEYGFEVERHLVDDDLVLFNR